MLLATCDRLYSASPLGPSSDGQSLPIANDAEHSTSSFAYSLTYALLTQGSALRLPSGNSTSIVSSKLRLTAFTVTEMSLKATCSREYWSRWPMGQMAMMAN